MQLGSEQLELLTGTAKAALAAYLTTPDLQSRFPLAAAMCSKGLALLAAALQQLAGSTSLQLAAVMHCRELCRLLKDAFLPAAQAGGI